MKQLNNLPKVTQAWILTPGQCECTCFSRQELGRGGKNNLSCENLLDSNPGHERLEWEILILFGSESESECHSVMSDSLRSPGVYRLWNSPGQNTGVGSVSVSPGALPNPGIEPWSPTLQVDGLPAESLYIYIYKIPITKYHP